MKAEIELSKILQPPIAKGIKEFWACDIAAAEASATERADIIK